MTNERVFQMPLARVYPLLVNKAARKGRTQAEVDEIITWLTGYSAEDIQRMLKAETAYGDFFRNAPAMNPRRTLVRGSICGVKLEDIEDPLMRDIRCLDKLIDELARGKSMDKILRI